MVGKFFASKLAMVASCFNVMLQKHFQESRLLKEKYLDLFFPGNFKAQPGTFHGANSMRGKLFKRINVFMLLQKGWEKSWLNLLNGTQHFYFSF